MAKIINPYKGVNWANQQKANLHCHTAMETIDDVLYGSDGMYTAAQMIDYYYNAGYKILAITDHDYNSNVLGSEVTTYPWTLFGRDPTTLDMLAVQGKELSYGHHRVSLFSDLGIWEDKSTFNVFSRSFGEMLNRSGIGFVAHPPDFSYTVDDFSKLLLTNPNSLVGIEVYQRLVSATYLLDEINTRTIPYGKICYGSGDDDAHNTQQIFTGYLFVLSDDISEANVKAAIKNGRSYFCYETLHTGEAKAPRITNVVVDENENIITITADSGTIIWYTEEHAEAGMGNVFDYSGFDKCFVRAEITNEFGQTSTQPFAFKNNTSEHSFEGMAKVDGYWFTGKFYSKFNGEWTESNSRIML